MYQQHPVIIVLIVSYPRSHVPNILWIDSSIPQGSQASHYRNKRSVIIITQNIIITLQCCEKLNRCMTMYTVLHVVWSILSVDIITLQCSRESNELHARLYTIMYCIHTITVLHVHVVWSISLIYTLSVDIESCVEDTVENWDRASLDDDGVL